MSFKILFHVKDLAVAVLQKQEKLITKLKVVHQKKVSHVNQVNFKVQYKLPKKQHVYQIWIIALHF